MKTCPGECDSLGWRYTERGYMCYKKRASNVQGINVVNQEL